MPKPNVFVVGSARCGTTTISEVLKLQNDFYVPDIKEPKTLAINSHQESMRGKGDRYYYRKKPKNISEYIKLFDGQECQYRVDASTSYLYYYAEAIENIKAICDNPKIIIILRNPVERAFSQYSLMVRDGREKLNFQRAIADEKQRIEAGWEYAWHYAELGFYADQVEAFKENFNDVSVIPFEVLFKSGVCDFEYLSELIGVRVEKVDITKENSSYSGYSGLVSSVKNSFLGDLLRGVVGDKFKRKIKSMVSKDLVVEKDLLTSEYLKQKYIADVKRLSLITGINFSQLWRM